MATSSASTPTGHASHDLGPPAERIGFVHIPKTGGTTLESCLAASLLPCDEGIFRVDTVDFESPYWSPEALMAPRLVAGHRPYRTLLGRFGGPRLWLTLLRDPEARIRSAFDHLARGGREPFLFEMRCRGASVEEMACALAGHPGLVARHLREVCVRFLRERPWSQDGTDPVSRSDLEDARRNLEGLACFAILERMRESLALFSYVSGLPPLDDPPHLNRRPAGQGGFALADLGLDLPSLVGHDAGLYAFAVTEFEARIAAMRDVLRRDHGLAEPCGGGTPGAEDMESALARASYRRHDGAGRLDPWWYRQPGRLRLGAGWHGPEPLRELGHPRWTGPQAVSRLWVAIPRSTPMRIGVSLTYTLSSRGLRTTRFRIDGSPVDPVWKDRPGGGFVAWLEAPRMAPGEEAITSLEILSPDIRTGTGTGRARQLGVLVESIEARPDLRPPPPAGSAAAEPPLGLAPGNVEGPAASGASWILRPSRPTRPDQRGLTALEVRGLFGLVSAAAGEDEVEMEARPNDAWTGAVLERRGESRPDQRPIEIHSEPPGIPWECFATFGRSAEVVGDPPAAGTGRPLSLHLGLRDVSPKLVHSVLDRIETFVRATGAWILPLPDPGQEPDPEALEPLLARLRAASLKVGDRAVVDPLGSAMRGLATAAAVLSDEPGWLAIAASLGIPNLGVATALTRTSIRAALEPFGQGDSSIEIDAENGSDRLLLKLTELWGRSDELAMRLRTAQDPAQAIRMAAIGRIAAAMRHVPVP